MHYKIYQGNGCIYLPFQKAPDLCLVLHLEESDQMKNAVLLTYLDIELYSVSSLDSFENHFRFSCCGCVISFVKFPSHRCPNASASLRCHYFHIKCSGKRHSLAPRGQSFTSVSNHAKKKKIKKIRTSHFKRFFVIVRSSFR